MCVVSAPNLANPPPPSMGGSRGDARAPRGGKGKRETEVSTELSTTHMRRQGMWERLDGLRWPWRPRRHDAAAPEPELMPGWGGWDLTGARARPCPKRATSGNERGSNRLAPTLALDCRGAGIPRSDPSPKSGPEPKQHRQRSSAEFRRTSASTIWPACSPPLHLGAPTPGVSVGAPAPYLRSMVAGWKERVHQATKSALLPAGRADSRRCTRPISTTPCGAFLSLLRAGHSSTSGVGAANLLRQPGCLHTPN